MSWVRSRRSQYGLLACIVALGLLLRVWGLGWGLHDADVTRRPHPDEWVVYWLTRWFDASHSLNPCPPTGGKCFFDWGALFPDLAYGLHFLLQPFFAAIPHDAFGTRGDLTFIRAVLAGRLLSALLSTLTIVVAYFIGLRCYGSEAGLLAALLVAVSGLLIQLAHFATPDSATLLLLALALWSILTAAENPGPIKFLVTGIAIGAAAGSEYHMALLSVPLAVAWWLRGDRKLKWLLFAAAGACITFLVLNVYLLVDFSAFWAATEHTLRIRTVDSSVQYGDRWAPYGPAWLFVVRFPLGYGVGFALAGWMILGVLWACLKRDRASLILLSWLGPYFLLVTLEPAKFMRYSAPLLLPLAVLAGRFALDLTRTGSTWLRGLFITLAALSVLYSAIYDSAYAGLFSSVEPRAAATAWVASHAAPGTTVAYEEIPDGLVNLAAFLPRPLKPCFTQFQVSRLAGDRYVMLDAYTREEQPVLIRPQMARFFQVLSHGGDYRLVRRVDYTPTFLGLRFDIAASPHDWRYPTHEITVYRRVTPVGPPGKYCFATVGAAAKALYVPSVNP